MVAGVRTDPSPWLGLHLGLHFNPEVWLSVGCSPMRKGNDEEASDLGDNLNAILNSYTSALTCRLLIKSSATGFESKTWLGSLWPKKILGYLSGILVNYYLPALCQPAWGCNYKCCFLLKLSSNFLGELCHFFLCSGLELHLHCGRSALMSSEMHTAVNAGLHRDKILRSLLVILTNTEKISSQ